MKACHDFNNDFTLFTAVPVLFNIYTNKDSNLISYMDYFLCRPIYAYPYTINLMCYDTIELITKNYFSSDILAGAFFYM